LNKENDRIAKVFSFKFSEISSKQNRPVKQPKTKAMKFLIDLDLLVVGRLEFKVCFKCKFVILYLLKIRFELILKDESLSFTLWY